MVAGAILDRETAHVEYRIHKSTRVAFSLLVHDQLLPAPYASYTTNHSAPLWRESAPYFDRRDVNSRPTPGPTTTALGGP